MKIVVAFILSLLVLPLMAEPNKKEPRFFLIPKYPISKTEPFNTVKLLKGPSKDSLIVKEIVLDQRSPLFNENMEKFYEGKDVWPYLTITSSHKKNNYFSVYFNGDYYWVNIEDFSYVLTFKEYYEYLKRRIFFVFEEQIALFDSIEGKELPWSTITRYKKDNLPYEITIPLDKVQLVDNHVWLRFLLGKPNGGDTYVLLDKPIPIWIRAYDDNGKVNHWYYGAKVYFPREMPHFD